MVLLIFKISMFLPSIFKDQYIEIIDDFSNNFSQFRNIKSNNYKTQNANAKLIII